jgi:PAS domain S-box-containing protein
MTTTGREVEQTGQAHDALRESEERYRAVVQQVSEAIFLVDVETKRLLEANTAFLRLLGYSDGEVQDLTIYDLLPYDRERIDRTTHKAVEQGEYHVSDRLYRRKDGSLVVVEVSITTISYSGKRVLCQVLRDITERKKIEDVLAARVQQQAGVARLGQQALAGADVATLMQTAAALVAETLGVEYCKVLELLPSGNELLLRAGVGWQEGLVGQLKVGAGLDSQSGYTLVSDAPVIVEDLRTETRFNGPPLLHSHNVISGMSVIIRGRGRPFGVVGAHTASHRIFTRDDIYFLQAIANVLAEAIERDKVEQELQASRDQLEVILQGVADGITVQDPVGRVIYANNAAVRLIGYSSQAELLAAPSAEIVSRFELVDEQNQPLSPMDLPGRYALQGQEAAERIVGWHVLATGEMRWSIVKAAPVKNEQGQVQLAVSIFRDITERVELDRHKDDFIALVSHELKTPITSMKIYTQVLKRRFERAAAEDAREARPPGEVEASAESRQHAGHELALDAVKQLARIDQQLNKLTDLVRDLLDASKLSAGRLSYNMEQFELGTLVRETVEDLQRIADKHTIVLAEHANPPVVADRERVRQVLTNFITNAIKYSPQADRIIVGATVSEEGEKDAKGITIYVQDFGIGIPRSQQDRVFDRFYQVSAAEAGAAARDTFPGLGLGLYISSEIVKRHGGKIWVDSEVDRGSTFYFTLPGTEVT